MIVKKLKKNHAKSALLCSFATILLLICSLVGCTANSAKPISKTGFVLNTVVTITVFNERDAEYIPDCFKKCEEYELIFSRTNKNSELYTLNHTGSMEVSDDLLKVITHALHYCEISEGNFDITTGQLSDIYGFATENPQVPTEAQLSEILPHIDYRKISVEGKRVTLNDPKAEIDLGAIAKGYIADCLRDYLISCGVESAIINLGGNVYCLGAKPDGEDFTVSIQYPFKERTETITQIHVRDTSVVTSGIYERYFEKDGILYHHILNSRTGYSYDTKLLSTTIIGPNSEACDALSTLTFTLGLEKGLALIEDTDGYEGIFITDDMKLHYSKGARQLVNKKNDYLQVNAKEAKALMDTKTDYIILDVRTAEEYAEGHIPNAVLIPHNEINLRAEKELTDKDQLILVYCRSGNRSKSASADLVKLGYTNVVEFGGIRDWPYDIVL